MALAEEPLPATRRLAHVHRPQRGRAPFGGSTTSEEKPKLARPTHRWNVSTLPSGRWRCWRFARSDETVAPFRTSWVPSDSGDRRECHACVGRPGALKARWPHTFRSVQLRSCTRRFLLAGTRALRHHKVGRNRRFSARPSATVDAAARRCLASLLQRQTLRRARPRSQSCV